MDSVLTSRDSLDNIAEVRKRIESQKSVVDGQLQAEIEAETQQLIVGINALHKVRNQVTSIQQNTSNISTAWNVSQNAVENFPQIQNLHTVAKNFELTRSFVENFQTLHTDLKEINDMMDDPRGSYEQVDGIYFMWLLPIHKKLDSLISVRKQAQHYALSSSEDVRVTIKRHFEPLDAAIKRFEKSFFEIGQDLLELARIEPSVVVRMSKIVDFEERKEVMDEYGAENGYPRRLLQVIRDTNREKFLAYKQQMGSPQEILEKFDWIFKDLKIVQKFLSKLMPQRWNILNSFVTFYHEQTYEIMTAIVKDDPPAALVLQILDWTKAYYAKVDQLFGISRDSLKPALLDGQEKQLYDDFLYHLVQKLREWYKTVAIQEKRPFIERNSAPDTQADETLCLNTHTDMNQLVLQQLKAAAQSNQSRIVVGCVDACCDLLMQRQKEWSDLVGAEVEKEINGTVEGVPAGLFEYLIALANEQDRGQEFLDELASKWTESLSRKYQAQALEKFEQTEDGFLDVARKCIDGMIQLIMNDLQKAFVDVFVSKNWKKGITLHQICTTLQEYLSEAQSLMLPDLFATFVERLCRATVLQYLRAMGAATHKVKPEGRDRVLADVKQLHDVFNGQVEPETARHFFGVFGPVVDTISCPVAEVPEQFKVLRQDYWDAPLDLFENMVAIRKDVDKNVLREVMGKVRFMAVQTQSKPSEQNTFLHGFK